MKADKIFEKLGYEKQKVYVGILTYKNNNYDAEIEFDLGDQTIYANKDDEAVYLDMQELQAINKKCEELGWIN